MHARIKEILDETGVAYRVHFHKDFPFAIRTPQDFAFALNYELARITKSLLLRASDKDVFLMAFLSCNKRLNLNRLANSVAVERLQIADEEELKRMLGYPRHGVSPIGAKGMRVFMDEDLLAFPTILVGAGKVAVELEISPQALRDITRADVLLLS